MRCPYLRDTEATSCDAASPPRVLLRSPRGGEGSACCSSAWRGCALAPVDSAPPDATQCPALRRVAVRYCAATPHPKLVPGADGPPSLCERDTHRRCPAFPREERGGATTEQGGGAGVTLPAGLRLARTHLWLDMGADGSCHVGADSFVAALLGDVACVWFATRGGLQRPTAILSLGTVALPLSFPHALRIVRTNPQLRRSPGLLVADPYGEGWLFEAACPGGSQDAAACGLLVGEEAQAWLGAEVQRLTRFVRNRFPRLPGPFGLAGALSPEELVELFGQFFLGDTAAPAAAS